MYGRVLFGKENRRQYPSLRFFRFCLKHCRWGCRSRCSRASCSLRHCVRLLSAFPFSRPAASSSCVRRPNSRNISAESLVCLCRSIRGHPVSRLRVSYRRDAVSLESAGSGEWAGRGREIGRLEPIALFFPLWVQRPEHLKPNPR